MKTIEELKAELLQAERAAAAAAEEAREAVRKAEREKQDAENAAVRKLYAEMRGRIADRITAMMTDAGFDTEVTERINLTVIRVPNLYDAQAVIETSFRHSFSGSLSGGDTVVVIGQSQRRGARRVRYLVKSEITVNINGIVAELIGRANKQLKANSAAEAERARMKAATALRDRLVALSPTMVLGHPVERLVGTDRHDPAMPDGLGFAIELVLTPAEITRVVDLLKDIEAQRESA